MNFKQFISGVSALAVASSVFAGLAVTASAEEAEDKTATIDATADTYIWGNQKDVTDDNRKESHGTDEEIIIDQATPLLMDKTPGLKDAHEIGLFKFDYSDYADPASISIKSAKLVYYIKTDNSDNKGSAGIFNRINDDTWQENNSAQDLSWVIRGNGTPFVTPSVALPAASGNTYTKAEVDVTSILQADLLSASGDKDTVGILSLAATTTNARQTKIASKENSEVDGPKLVLTYAEEAWPEAETLEVQYQTADGDVIGSRTIDIPEGNYVGSTYSYYLPAYVEGTGDYTGKLYKVASTYDRSAMLSSVNTSVTESVTLVTDAVHQYEEYDGDQVYSPDDRSKNASNGSVHTVGATHTTILTVKDSGIYTIKLGVAPNSKSSNDRNFYLTINDENQIREGHCYYNAWEDTIEKVSLQAGDNLVYYGAAGTVAIDYVVIIKTDEYVAPTTRDEGFKFETGIEEVKNKFTTLVITGIESDEPKSREVDITDQLNSLSGEGDVSFSVLLKDLPEDVEITSITLK